MGMAFPLVLSSLKEGRHDPENLLAKVVPKVASRLTASRDSRAVCSLHAWLKQVPKSRFGHPVGACQMALMDRFGTG